MGFFKSLFSDAVNDLKERIAETVDDVTGIDLSEKFASKNTVEKTMLKGEYDHDKQIFGIDSLRVKFNGSKYAVCYTDEDEPQETSFIYDDIIAMSPRHLRTSQVQKDGSVLFGVVTGGASFGCTECEYSKVEFFDGETLLVTDEDDDQYTIDCWGKTTSLELYLKNLEKALKNEDEDDEDSDDDDFDYESEDEE